MSSQPVHAILDLIRTFTPFRPLEFSIKFQTNKPELSIMDIERSQIIIYKIKILFLSLKMDFCLSKQ